MLLPGSIFETRKRARVPYLLYALSLVLIVEIAFNGDPLSTVHWPAPHAQHASAQSWQVVPIEETIS